ncbi:MAG: DUF3108 domain-containing protein [Burkholderiaceae bacterium]|nr:DUF3108 domain-containing protein [Burkholderiaceae bacterium]
MRQAARKPNRRRRAALARGALAALALLGAPLPGPRAQPRCPAEDWPQRLALEYSVTASRGPLAIEGRGVLTFEREGGTYRIESEAEAAGLYRARYRSRGTLTPQGLRPDEYVEARGGRPPLEVRFDWRARHVHFSATPDVQTPLPAGTQDRASLLLQLHRLRRTQPALERYEMAVAGARRLRTFRFERRPAERVTVPAGEIEAVALRLTDEDPGESVEAWYAPGWCDLPVRIRYGDPRGGVVDYRLRAARIE